MIDIDCIDEGVDIPAVDSALIIASSSNSRQFIQRRGRILRQSSEKNLATLMDVIVLPPHEVGREAKWMLRGELSRVKEMAELAENRATALLSVKRLTAQYGVLLTELMTEDNDEDREFAQRF